ncbi:hypothetical protein [Rhizobium binae]|uniref:hypothetical protein n=1 Tax=Rhizobium binae TaxID=1138190 RepID=UPI001C82DAC0|nr:hypothetical protein [Rhizobium binae]MBX4941123.1 hypothetical protein [Rhizobium binae]
MAEMITERVDDSDIVGSSIRVVDLIAALQAVLERVPQDFRAVATLEIEAWDWNGSHIEYERPITDAEIAARAAAIEEQRQRAAKAKADREVEAWLRNIRINTGIKDRDEAMEFLRTNADANHYHPAVFRTGNHGHA